MNITGISPVMYDEINEPYVKINPQLSKYFGWGDPKIIEWEIKGEMAIIRKRKNAGSSKTD